MCDEDGPEFPIVKGVPRFVTESEYAATFGRQWNWFRQTQLDKFIRMDLSRQRFLAGTGWRPEELKDRRILEVGCGAGRFTQIMLEAGAHVRSVDISTAVDACYQNHGSHPNLLVVQADGYRLPFRAHSFDYVFCYGVIQHTPDPRALFMSLVSFLKPGAQLAIDVYHKGWALEPYKTKYFYRPLTTRMPREMLFRLIQWYVPKWLPIDTAIKRLPIVGRVLGMIIPCWNYHYLSLSPKEREEWGVLDTFDALASTYDYPQTVETVREWFRNAGLADIHVRLGGNGVLGNGRAPAL